MREAHLFGRVLKGTQVGARQCHLLFAAGADLPAFLRQGQQFLRGLDHVLGDLKLEPRLAGSEPTLRHCGRQRLPAKLKVRLD